MAHPVAQLAQLRQGVGAAGRCRPSRGAARPAGQRGEPVAGLGAGRGEQLRRPGSGRRRPRTRAGRGDGRGHRVLDPSGTERKRSPSVAATAGGRRPPRATPAPRPRRAVCGSGRVRPNGTVSTPSGDRARASRPGAREGDESPPCPTSRSASRGAAASRPPRRSASTPSTCSSASCRTRCGTRLERRPPPPRRPRAGGRGRRRGPARRPRGQRLGGAPGGPSRAVPAGTAAAGAGRMRPRPAPAAATAGAVGRPRRGARPAGQQRASRRSSPPWPSRTSTTCGSTHEVVASSGGATARGSACSRDHPVAPAAAVRGEHRPVRGQPIGRGPAEQVQHEVDRRPAPGDVVLQIAVEPLVAQVRLGAQRDQDDVEVEVGQPVLARAATPTPVRPSRSPPRPARGRRLRSPAAPRRAAQPALGLLGADVQPAERVAPASAPNRTPGGLGRRPQQFVEAAEGEELRRRGRDRGLAAVRPAVDWRG